jgi:hypothetical protein
MEVDKRNNAFPFSFCVEKDLITSGGRERERERRGAKEKLENEGRSCERV